MMAGRRRSLGLVVVAVLVVLPLVLVPPPLVSARVPPQAGGAVIRFIGHAKAPVQKIIRSLLKEWVKHEVKELLSPNSEGQLNNAASSSNTAGVFIFNLSVGTSSPPQDISGILDITSELVWSQCTPCGDACLPPPAPSFDPAMSPTFANLSCDSEMCPQVLRETCAADAAPTGDCDMYKFTYGDTTTSTVGYLANDTLMFGDGATPVPFVFGCSYDSVGDFSGASGVLGFNLGDLSLVSQLNLTWFSYLLASDASAAAGSESDSVLQFGGGSVPLPPTSNGRSTPLLFSSLYPTLYFFNLTGIRVDGQDLSIPAGTFDLKDDGSGGVFPSTTVPVTYLEKAAYDAVSKAIAGSSVMPQSVDGSELGLHLCYNMTSLEDVTVPVLELVFDGAAVMTLQRYNYFFSDNTTGLDCLTILPYVGGSLLGSLLQTGTSMTYDIADKQLIFETQAAAASPANAPASLIIMMTMLNLAAWVLWF
ncbi:hypothetical protein BS78_04G019700 [Paspalum vaginatum]|nr:hypothetical protein BS78_04G019700 [Paspalum vaginatum]